MHRAMRADSGETANAASQDVRGPVHHPQEAMRRRHSAAVLDVLRSSGVASHQAISTRTGLSQATVSRILGQLRTAGMIEAAAPIGASGRGRPPSLVRLAPQGRFAVGIELEDTRCIAALTDLHARLLQRTVTRPRYDTPEALTDTIVHAYHRVLEGAESTVRERVYAIGVGVPGVVDTDAGVLRLAPGLGAGLRDVPLAVRLRERLGLPVAIANRSKAAAVGEHLYGAGRGCDHLLYVWIGFGIAAGLVLGGAPYFGAGGSAGELGHVVVVPDGPPCACGGRGCLQAVAAGPAIARRARERLRAGEPSMLAERFGAAVDLVDSDAVVSAAADGDWMARGVLEEAGAYLGRGLAAAVNLLNPARIILGGPVGQPAAPFLADALMRALRIEALSVPLAELRVVAGTLGEDAGAIGAAALGVRWEHALA